MLPNVRSRYSFVTLIKMIVLILLAYNFVIKCLEINFIQDDAYTSFRYANNFVEGKGLVFNEGERVEGYTNFLWVMLLSLIYSLNIDLETASQIISICFGVGAIWLTYLLSRLIIIDDRFDITHHAVVLLPPFLVSLSAPMTYWSVSGMETSMFVSFTLLSIYFFMKRHDHSRLGWGFIVISFLNSLLRPEGIFIFILLCSFDCLAIRYKIYPNVSYGSTKYFNGKRVAEIVIYILLVLSYVIFRLIYYGYLFPNTFYAKTEFTIQFLVRGLNYFFEFAQNNLLFGLLLVLPAFAYQKAKHQVMFFYYFILINFMAIIMIGGDVLPIYRFFLPFLPIVFIFSIKGLFSLNHLINFDLKILRAAFAITVIIVIIIFGFTNYQQQLPYIIEKRSYEAGLVKKMKIYADWIESSSANDKQTAVALSTIGSFSYNTNARIIDIVGLTNGYIAHNPKEVVGIDENLPVLWRERHYNADYVLQQKPDYIIFPAGAKPSAFAECALFVQEKFYRGYYTQLIYSSELNQLLPVFTKRNEPLLTNRDCDVKFIKHYINASTIVNRITPLNKNSLLVKLISICDNARTYCSSRSSDIDAIEGIGFYNVGEYEKSNGLFKSALQQDSLNMIAHFYSMKISQMQNRIPDLLYHYRMLQKYSPSVFGSYTN